MFKVFDYWGAKALVLIIGTHFIGARVSYNNIGRGWGPRLEVTLAYARDGVNVYSWNKIIIHDYRMEARPCSK